MKALSNLYTVEIDGEFYECIPKGVFRYRNQKPVVGDIVEVKFDDGKNFIVEIKERKNQLLRPAIANIDQAILVFSCKEPDFSLSLLDRFLVIIEHYDITPIIVVTKTDLIDQFDLVYSLLDDYKKAGYQVICTSSNDALGLEELKSIFKDKISVFTGQTGVGKSSLLNALDNELNLKTNEISKALGRGKHTTRHVELIPLFDGLVADSPGFSSLQYDFLSPRELAVSFHDFKKCSLDCKFRGCLHESEPQCKVKQEVELGNISQSRYTNYLNMLSELKNKKEIYK